jgi:hypothetical protein
LQLDWKRFLTTGYLNIHNDVRLNELNIKIKEIQEQEGLKDDEFFVRDDPDSPEDYLALNIEFEHRIDEIRIDILSEFRENELAELFLNNWMQNIKRYYDGWRVFEKDDPDILKEIDEDERLYLGELELEGV